MILLLALPLAAAHTGDFSLDRLSVAGSTVWGITEGWGAIVSHDAGASWGWVCEEGLIPEGSGSATLLYDVEALDDGTALLSAVGGVFRLDDACGLTRLTGLPSDTSVGGPLFRDGDGWLASIRSPKAAGLYRCSTTECAPTELVQADFAVHAVVRDGGTLWASSTVQSVIVGGLWRSTDGAAWSEVATWPAGSRVPYVLDAAGDRLLVWAQAWDIGDTSGLLRSTDGGATWSEVVSFGDYTRAPAALLRSTTDGRLRLGDASYTVYESSDDGATWTAIPVDDASHVTLRCVSDDGTLVCADHYVDGFDVGRVDGLAVEHVACLDEATVVPCLKEACNRAYQDFLAQGAYGGGACHEPGPDTGSADDTGTGHGKRGCDGCAGAGGPGSGGLAATLGLIGLGGLAVLRRRRR